MNPATNRPEISRQAVWSLILGILSLFCLWILGSIPAIILGSLALSKINRSNGEVGGRGFAVSGIVTGSVGVFTGLVSLGIFSAIGFPAYHGIQSRAQQAEFHVDMQAIYLGIESFRLDQGKLPEQLQELVPDYLADASGLDCEYRGEVRPYEYYPEAKAGEVFLSSPFVLVGRRAVVWRDGRRELVREIREAENGR